MKKKYLKFVGIFLVDQFRSVYHDLIVNARQSIDDLVKHLNSRLRGFWLLGNNLQDVTVKIKCVL